MSEQAPAQQEPLASTVMLPALVQGLTMGHRAQKRHSFALLLTQSPTGRALSPSVVLPLQTATLGLNKEAEELLTTAWEVFHRADRFWDCI